MPVPASSEIAGLRDSEHTYLNELLSLFFKVYIQLKRSSKMKINFFTKVKLKCILIGAILLVFVGSTLAATVISAIAFSAVRIILS